jgi:hypothetical protein
MPESGLDISARTARARWSNTLFPQIFMTITILMNIMWNNLGLKSAMKFRFLFP